MRKKIKHRATDPHPDPLPLRGRGDTIVWLCLYRCTQFTGVGFTRGAGEASIPPVVVM